MRLRDLVRIVLCCMLAAGSATVAMAMPWKPHTVRQINGAAPEIAISAKLQIVTEQWNRVAAVPNLVYMPEKDRLLMMVLCDDPHRAMVISSDDRGKTWSPPRWLSVDNAGQPKNGSAVGLTYLGSGKVAAFSGDQKVRWLSLDYGQTWERCDCKGPAGTVYTWDPPLRMANSGDGAARLVQGGYRETGIPFGSTDGAFSHGCIQFSADEGRTWRDEVIVPQWLGINEVCVIRAKNDDWVAACRTDPPKRFMHLAFDHYCGLAISISKDKGKTWSDPNILYEWGRHHPSMVLLSNGDIVMSYVVRLGYVRTPDGFPQFGVEAVVSHDNGRTWDLDHRCLLHAWVGNRKGPDRDGPGPQAWWASSQSTSSILLPDGSILTAFGTGYRSQPTPGGFGPRDIGLVLWRLGDKPLNNDRTIRDAPFNSDIRNLFDPTTGRPGMPSRPNVP